VFSHLPSNVLIVLVAFAPNLPVAIVLLALRASLSQMDVPTRRSYLMAVVTPEERPAASSVTTAPRGIATSLAPILSGYLLGITTFGWPLVACGLMKIGYDLALLKMFRSIKPPEETDQS